jgi:succinoglycan biosynthesis protein ExoM
MTGLSVVIPTFRRLDGLRRAVQSLTRQIDAPAFEVVIVDNSPEGCAHETARALGQILPNPLVYVHEPAPGVANARNAGVAAASGDFVAFLDDDEEASPGWLAALLATRRQFAASVVFGPIEAVIPPTVRRHRDYFQQFFSRVGPATDIWLSHPFGCGNSLMVRADALRGPAPFDPGYNEIGGEDDYLFQQLAARGVRFAWAAGAVCLEHVPERRARLCYTLRRAFAYGQSPCQLAAQANPPNWPGVVGWMIIGAAQSVVYGLASIAAWLASPQRAVRLLDRAVRGAGKVFWAPVFVPRFYGAHLDARTRTRIVR